MKKYTLIVLLLICCPLLSISQVPAALMLRLNGYDVKCHGGATGCAKVTPLFGVPPYTYQWSPVASTGDSISGLVPGKYSVTVTDGNGNIESGSVAINQPDPLTLYFDSTIVRPCFRVSSVGGGTCGCNNTLYATVNGGTPPYAYLWTPTTTSGNNTSSILKQACYIVYTVNVTDINNCSITDSINILMPGGASGGGSSSGGSDTNGGATGASQPGGASKLPLAPQLELNIYPNPATNQLNVSVNQSSVKLRNLAVYDIAGKKIFEQTLGGNERFITLNTSGLAEGNYLLDITSDESQQITHFSVSR